MTLPSEGINPWRAAPAPGGHGAAPATPPPAKLPAVKINGAEGLDGTGKTAGGKEFKLFGEDGATFWDLVDVVNPLQHIPVVSTLYRDLTNDTLDPAPRVMGSTLFMGPIGLVASVANVMIEHNTGKDLGGHVMAYFKDDAQPLATKTAAAGPAAAGTDGADGIDPVTQWAAEQTAFYRQGQTGGETGGDAVGRWAAEQNAFYQGRSARSAETASAPAAGAGNGDPVADWARAQHAYYRGGAGDTPASQLAEASTPAGPAAAGTDGIDVTAWAQAQNAYYREGAATVRTAGAAAADNPAVPAAAGTDGMDVASWAAEQTAFYRGESAPATATDPVSAWAERQTAYYRAGAETGRPATGRDETLQTAQTQATQTGSSDDVSNWARDQLAWVMGDRAKEVASLAGAPPASRSNQPASDDKDPDDRQDRAAQASGAVTAGGGWFSDNMVKGWSRYQAAQQLAEPGYRPDLDLAAAGR